MAAQNEPMTVCILLAPTQLKPEERNLLADIARQAESLAQMQTRGTNFGNPQINPSQNKTDPQLRWESRLYAANLRRLNHPFLATIFCFSRDQSAAQQVASALASTIREEQAYEPPLGEAELIPSGAKVTAYPQSSYLQAVCQLLDFSPLLFYIHEKDAPDNTLQRLRYLIDGRGAASAFRFPISVEGGVPGIAVKQRPPDFHPGPRNQEVPSGHIDLGRFHVGGRATLSKNAFTKHALITGFTGSGKSNTSLYLLDQFWRKFRIPFLVIESAKKEYRGLRKVDVFQNLLRIYTLGDETVSPLRFNPFELIPGVRVEAHIAKLQTCFEGALPHVGPLPSVIAEGLEVIYREKGWRLTDKSRGEGELRQFPTMADFYTSVEKVLQQRGYQGEVKSNVEAAIKGRIKPLLMGSKGSMFGCSVSQPSAEELFTQPVILELNDLNEQDKSLLVMFFLTLLREYRELNPSRELTHITLVEEAHNVLGNVVSKGSEEGGTSDVKAKAVQSFCNMLAEVRAYGEGLIIADQSPEKLARDAMRNTNVQIAHQLRDAHDREAIANAMIMSEEQQDFLGKCETGRAAIFYTGLQKATFVDVPIYKDTKPPNYQGKFEYHYYGFDENLNPHKSDDEVRVYMGHLGGVKKQDVNCSLCEGKIICQHRDDIMKLVEYSKDDFKKACDRLKKAPNHSKQELLKQLAELILKVTNVRDEKNLDLAWCYTQELLHRYSEYKPERKRLFMGLFKEVIDN